MNNLPKKAPPRGLDKIFVITAQTKQNEKKERNPLRERSRKAAKEHSPQRKLWVGKRESKSAPVGRKENRIPGYARL